MFVSLQPHTTIKRERTHDMKRQHAILTPFHRIRCLYHHLPDSCADSLGTRDRPAHFRGCLHLGNAVMLPMKHQHSELTHQHFQKKFVSLQSEKAVGFILIHLSNLLI